ncbi:mitochondrial substrate/solute carrier [Baffinella frigidus]|nr:mitochondrial substrate/solute carrier [Cryptophyta sp. CCMP2293]
MQGDRESLTILEQLVAGTACAMPAALLTTPADVLKTRMQAAAGTVGSQSMRATAASMVKAEGLGVLMTGWGPRVALKAPALGIALLVVEVLSQAGKDL